MLYVKVHKNNIEKALRLFKKQVKESKLLVELRDREFYTKPSVLKREIGQKLDLEQKNSVKTKFFLYLYIFIYTKNTLRLFSHLVV